MEIEEPIPQLEQTAQTNNEDEDYSMRAERMKKKSTLDELDGVLAEL